MSETEAPAPATVRWRISPVFLDRLLVADLGHQVADKNASIESLQRETNRLLGQMIEILSGKKQVHDPHSIDTGVVDRVLRQLRELDADLLDRAVAAFVRTTDVNGYVAAYILARTIENGVSLRWVRRVIEGIGNMPPHVVSRLRSLETEALHDPAVYIRFLTGVRRYE